MAAHDPTDNELKILHWNIHSWRDDAGNPNIDAVADLIQATNPHIVSLVEVDEAWDTPSTLDQLATRTGHHTIFVPSFEFGEHQPAGGFGNALLTTLPIHTVRHRQLTWPPPRYDGTEPSEPRSVLLAKLNAPLGPVWIGTTHLPRSEPAQRNNALRQLTTIIQDLPDPWLLIGDFNTPPISWLHEYPLLTAYPEFKKGTYPANAPTETIDYCVGPSRLNINGEIIDNAGSDHLPILIYYSP